VLANEGKAPRERLTLIRVFEALRGFWNDGGYYARPAYARAWRKGARGATAEAYVP